MSTETRLLRSRVSWLAHANSSPIFISNYLDIQSRPSCWSKSLVVSLSFDFGGCVTPASPMLKINSLSFQLSPRLPHNTTFHALPPQPTILSELSAFFPKQPYFSAKLGPPLALYITQRSPASAHFFLIHHTTITTTAYHNNHGFVQSSFFFFCSSSSHQITLSFINNMVFHQVSSFIFSLWLGFSLTFSRLDLRDNPSAS